VWNYERSFVLSNFKLDEILRREKQKNKNEKEMSSRKKTEQRLACHQIFLSSLSSLLSLKTWSKFVPRHVFHRNK